jgi:glutamate dehydrogenase/leucine dehydrogenase
MKKESKKINPFEVAKKQVHIAAQYINLDSGLMEKLKTTKREMIVHLSVKMDDGYGQDLQELIWSEEKVLDRLTRIMQQSFKEVLEISLSKKIPMKTAALVLGIGRVAEAQKLRGIYP